MNDKTTPATDSGTKDSGDIAALAKGGRTNFLGFLLRLLARLPFLFIGGRLYGAEALGRFASALVIVELVAMVCTIGEKRGLAQRLSDNDCDEDDRRGGIAAGVVCDGLLTALIAGSVIGLTLWLVPAPMFPSGIYTDWDRLIVLAIPALALTEILLAAQAYRYDIATTVRSRAVVEPWTISIMAGLLYFVIPDSGLSLAYLASIYAALLTAAIPFLRLYGLPQSWSPSFARMRDLTLRGLPLAGADTIEWGTRRLDIFILGLFASPAGVGVYYVAQQVASLPQKLKTSFEPILGPVITRKLKEKDYAAIARQVCQVGFWITAAQAGIALALGIPGEGIMGLVGPNFVGGTGALSFLLAAEVVAATAVVSEAALVYVARLRNLWISIGTIVLQGLLTVGVMLLANAYHVSDLYRAGGAALALMTALAVSSIVKAMLLARLLNEPINNWRWSLLYAVAVAGLVGFLITRLPEWAELSLGVPAILLSYGFVVWKKGFGPEDRVLFRKKLDTGEA
ncbi:lipopolysaccharide biosynthesis protein [Altericroceibacterium spongiae]|uniref:Lipopolysaccharide biosynthesis protein n=1 Tax=Altericroceibacterium spongiae TaxID=2320269 RepID=A0A420EBZ3_9SPHN|nr:lipopolysaccharide biosynthesis protein [Altericroceibacterium spongiae]RKF18217.1 lipopolysaccharide biosynthesis protein [Altericroceibacterium spongiae]